MARRAFVVVVDGCGVGALADAADYGDTGANTLLHVAQAVGGLSLPVLGALGLGNILELPGVAPSRSPVCHGRLHALGPGKDSIAGHWELAGVVAAAAPPTFPQGLPAALLTRVETVIGTLVLCNRAYNGVAAIASRPIGTRRSFEPFPRAHRSSSWTSTSSSVSPTASDARSPQA